MDREKIFREVFTDHYARVVRAVFWIVHDWDRSEEITPDAFVQLLRMGARYRAMTSRMRGCAGSRSDWR